MKRVLLLFVGMISCCLALGCGGGGGGSSSFSIPTIVSISPNSGPQGGGTLITIMGTGFVSGSTSVTIGGKSLQNLVIVSGSELNGKSPLGASTGAKDVKVTTPGGTATTVNGFTYTTDNVVPTFAGLVSIIATSSTSLELRWSSASDDVSASSKITYLIYMATTSGGQSFSTASFTSQAGVLSFQVPGLESGKTYFFVVRAKDEAGNTESNSIEKSAAPLSAPTLSWSQIQNLVGSRSLHTTTLLPSGKILIVGGDNAGVLDTAEIFDPATGIFQVTKNGSGTQTKLVTARKNHTATLLPNGKVLIAGGEDGSSNPLDKCELFDPSTGVFDDNSGALLLKHKRSKHTATLLSNGKVLIAGGKNDTAGTPEIICEIYDPSGAFGTFDDNTGNRKLNAARHSHTATLLSDGTVLLAGGQDGTASTNKTNTAEIYNSTNDTFTNTTGNMQKKRAFHSATLLSDGKVLLSGGEDETPAVLNTVELFDPTGKTFAFTKDSSNTQTNLTGARKNHTSTMLPNGKILFCGGDSGGALNTTEVYDPSKGTYASGGTLNFNRTSHTAILLMDGSVLLAGGDNAGALNRAETLAHQQALFLGTVNNMQANRGAQFTSTLLSDGTILVAGGASGTNAFSSAEIYTPTSSSFSNTGMGQMKAARRNHTATLLPGGKVLIAGGDNAANPTSASIASTELYDPSTGFFDFTKDGSNNSTALSQARTNHTATLLSNGKVLLAGGRNSGNPLNTAELYDIATGTFDVTRNGSNSQTFLNTTRANHTATLLPDGKVLILGGKDLAGNILDTGEVYDPSAGTFSALTNAMKAKRFHHTATLLPNGTVLLVGGDSSGTGIGVNSAEIFTPGSTSTNGTFDFTRDISAAQTLLTSARKDHTATLLFTGRVLITGGIDSTGAGTIIKKAEIYNPITGKFSATTDMSLERSSHTATLLPDGRVLIAGGKNNSAVLNGAEIFENGLGIGDNFRAVISTLASSSTFPIEFSFGVNVSATGTRFRGLTGASGGSTQDSSTDAPILLLMGLDGGNGESQSGLLSRTFLLSARNWNSTVFDFTLPSSSNNPAGYYLLVPVVNGIPGFGKIIRLK